MKTSADQVTDSAAKPAAIIALLACATADQRRQAFDKLHTMSGDTTIREAAAAVEWATKAPARRVQQ